MYFLAVRVASQFEIKGRYLLDGTLLLSRLVGGFGFLSTKAVNEVWNFQFLKG